MLFNLPRDIINLVIDKVLNEDPTFIFQVPQIWFIKYLNYTKEEFNNKIIKCLKNSKIPICNLILSIKNEKEFNIKINNLLFWIKINNFKDYNLIFTKNTLINSCYRSNLNFTSWLCENQLNLLNESIFDIAVRTNNLNLLKMLNSKNYKWNKFKYFNECKKLKNYEMLLWINYEIYKI
jgi:hypothetical protein